MRRWLPLMLIALALACGDDGPSRPPLPVAPSILSVTFSPDTLLVDTVHVAVEAARADSVMMWVDGLAAGVDAEIPYRFAWDSRSVKDGAHDFHLRAVNDGGTADTSFTRLVANVDPGVIVTVAPADTFLMAGQQVQFSASVQGTENTAVDWSVEVPGGASLEGGPGTVDTTGLYTAPDPAPDGDEVLVRATSRADPTRSATARVIFDEAVSIEVTWAPTQVRLGNIYQLEARVRGTSYDLVRWSIAEDRDFGHMYSSGGYLAPNRMPDPPRVTFVARAAFYPQVSDTVAAEILEPITIEFVSLPPVVYIGRSYRIQAQVVDHPDPRLRFSIDGGPAHGTIDQNGFYTAPPTRPVPSEVTFRATSLADTLETVTQTVPIQSTVHVSIIQPPGWVLVNRTATFQAAVSGTTDTRVRWSVENGPAFGTIDETGLYTAPSVRPDPPIAWVRATSLADTLESARTSFHIYGPVVVVVSPESVGVSLGDRQQFTAYVQNAPDTDLTWAVLGGDEYGTINQDGLYTAPLSLPDPPEAIVRARSEFAYWAQDSGVVQLTVEPSPNELAVLRETYRVGDDLTSLAEQVTGIAGTALGLARYLGGDDQIRSGSLIQEETGNWFYDPRDGNTIDIEPKDGPWTIITYAVADGLSPAQHGELRYCRGIEFKGDLDFTIRVNPRGPDLRVISSSQSLYEMAKPNCPCATEGSYRRTLQGAIQGADGGIWTLDVTLDGMMVRCSDSTMRWTNEVTQTISGTVSTPSGLTVVAQDSFSVRSDGQGFSTTAFRAGFEGSLTAYRGANTYEWNGLSIFRSWDEAGPRDLAAWRAQGQVIKNKLQYGVVRFDGPVSPGMTTYPRPIADFGGDAQFFLGEYRFTFDDPSRPALSPFQEAYWKPGAPRPRLPGTEP